MPDEDYKAPIDISKEQWANLLKDEKIITEKYLELLKALYSCEGYKARASQLATLLQKDHPNAFNFLFKNVGQRILDKLNIQAPIYHYSDKPDEKGGWWNFPFWGEKRQEVIYWILRPELQEAMQEIGIEEAKLLEITSPEERVFDEGEHLYEGVKKLVYVNRYERNRDARDQCVKYYGARCSICCFDFEERYGEVGRDIIHVHHLKPLSDIGETYRVDPIDDLRPVCPNCHIIIHTRNPPYSIDEVKAMIRNTRAK